MNNKELINQRLMSHSNEAERAADRPSWEKFSAKEWALALQGLTPGGSEYLTPQECTDYVRKRTDYPRMIIELRKRVEVLNQIEDLLTNRYGEENEPLSQVELKVLLDSIVQILEPRYCGDCHGLIPQGQQLCNCNTSGDLG